MDNSLPKLNGAEAQRTLSPTPLPPSTNNCNNNNNNDNDSSDADRALSQTFKNLSLSTAAATALPPSPQVHSPKRNLQRNSNYSPSPNASRASRSPLPRSSSSMSVDGRSSTPTLLRKASMNSLHGVGGVTPPRQSSSTRSSSAHLLNGQGIQGVGRSPLSSTEDVFAELPPVTAASVASDHFKTELNLHDNDAEGRPADTIVILHDSCYGHRFSRPRTSKAGLSTIVERPERIHASILGLSVAYVRLGERYAEGKYPLHPQRDASNIPSIPFRIRKTTRKMSLSSPAVTNVHGVKWMEELKIMCDTAEAKLAMNGKELTRPEMTRSPDQEVQKFHEGDLYLCSESLNAMEGALGAVCEGVDAVFNGTASGTGPQRAFVAIRPPGHHCSASHPSGFCWVNNVHVGIAHASLNHGLTHAAMIDFDLHHGDGSQAMAWAQNARATGLPKNAASWKKTSIGYFSLHDINSYPCEMGDEEKVKNASLCIENAHGQNIWNVHLQSWKSEAEFWELYETKYSVLLEKTRLFLKAQTARLRAIPNGPKPKAAIFLSAGFDASEWESSGMQRHSVNVPTEFYARLTRDVVKLAAEDGCGVEGRVVSVLEGGYSDRALASGVLSHISGLAGGDPVPVKREDSYNGLGWEMSQKARAITGEEGEILNKSSLDQLHEYDSDWWALRNLQALEAVVNPTDAPAPEPKKPRDLIPPTYSSPTQSFSAKIVATPNFKRSTSNMSNISGTPPRQVVRPPTPPPPDVDWATAAHELSKLLIPTDRQTMSCKPEDLSAEATRARRDRQSILMPPTQANGAPVEAQVVSTRMALRGRKAKLSTPEEEENIVERPVSRVNRRKTVAGTAISAVEKASSQSTIPKLEPSYKQPTKQSARRLSLASNTSSVTTEVPNMKSNIVGRHPSISSTNPIRPPSVSSVRPDSSMSSRGHSIPPVVVKKTRPAASTAKVARAESAKPARAPRKSPVGVGSASEIIPKSRVLSASKSQTTEVANTDIDSLSAGMKKIRVSLVTKAQKEAREQAKTAAGKATTKKTIPIEQLNAPDPAIPAAEAQLAASIPAPVSGISEAPPTAIARPSFTPQPLDPSRFAHLQDATVIPLIRSSPPRPRSPAITSNQNLPSAPTPPTHTYATASTGNSGANVFIPYQPEGPTPLAAVPGRMEELKWLEPNTGTPSPVKKSELEFGKVAKMGIMDVDGTEKHGIEKAQLPVFSATGVIPFGVKVEQKFNESIWDVPETPKK